MPITGLAVVAARQSVIGDAGDRHFDGDRADIEAAEAVDPERIDVVVILSGPGQQRQVAPQVERVEHRAEIDVESLGPLAREDADVGRRIGVDALRGEGCVVGKRRWSGVGGHGHERRATEERRADRAAHLGHRIGLTARQPLGPGTVEGGDPLQQPAQSGDVRIAEIRDGRGQSPRSAHRPVLRREPNFVDDIVRHAVAVVVDVDRVEDVIVEVEVIRAIARVLARIDVQNESDAPIGRSARDIGRVVTDKGVDIGVVGRRIQRDQRRFAVTGCIGAGAPCQGERRQQRDNKPGCVFHIRPPVRLSDWAVRRGLSGWPIRQTEAAGSNTRSGRIWMQPRAAAADAGTRRRAPEPWRKSLIELVFNRAAGNLRCPRGVLMIGEILAPKFLVLYAIVLSALYVHLRGRERFRFTRQLFNHSTLLAPYNALVFLFSAVPAKAFQDVGRFPELAPLREQWTMLRDEAQSLFDEGHIRGALANNDVGFNSFFKRGWKRFYVKWYGDPLPSAQALCPQHGGAPRDHSLGQGGDVRDPRARRALESAPRSVRRVAALSPRPRHSQLGRLLHRGRRRALLVARRRGGDVRRDIHPLGGEQDARRPASSCSATSSGRSPAGS